MADLYIIHGWTYTTSGWDKTLTLLKKAGLSVEMLRVPGLTEPSEKVWTIEDYVKWANKNLPKNAVVLGHSNGGRILLNLCAENPEKLQKLILLDSAGVYSPSLKKSIIHALAKIGKPLKKIPLIDKIFHRLTDTTDYSKAPENMKKTLQNMLESDKHLKLEKVTTKTYILWGQKDTITPPAQAEIIHQKLPNSDLKFYKNWPHSPYLTDPEGLAKAIIKIMKEE